MQRSTDQVGTAGKALTQDMQHFSILSFWPATLSRGYVPADPAAHAGSCTNSLARSCQKPHAWPTVSIAYLSDTGRRAAENGTQKGLVLKQGHKSPVLASLPDGLRNWWSVQTICTPAGSGNAALQLHPSRPICGMTCCMSKLPVPYK